MRSSGVTFTVRSRHIVVPIAGVARRGVLEQGREVGQQQRLVLVDDDGRRGVEGLDVDEAKANAGLGDKRLETIGQVDELGGTFGRDPDRSCADRSKCGASVSIDVLQGDRGGRGPAAGVHTRKNRRFDATQVFSGR